MSVIDFRLYSSLYFTKGTFSYYLTLFEKKLMFGEIPLPSYNTKIYLNISSFGIFIMYLYYQ